jgi:hypothetical protein
LVISICAVAVLGILILTKQNIKNRILFEVIAGICATVIAFHFLSINRMNLLGWISLIWALVYFFDVIVRFVRGGWPRCRG